MHGLVKMLENPAAAGPSTVWSNAVGEAGTGEQGRTSVDRGRSPRDLQRALACDGDVVLSVGGQAHGGSTAHTAAAAVGLEPVAGSGSAV